MGLGTNILRLTSMAGEEQSMLQYIYLSDKTHPFTLTCVTLNIAVHS